MKLNTRIISWILGAIIMIALSWWLVIYPRMTDLKTTINLSLDNNIESFDPAKVYSDDALILSAQVLEPLYHYHYLKRPYELTPLIAETLPLISSDQKNYIIKIKKNIYYHPHPAFKNQKRAVKAEDFVNQVKRVAIKELASPFWSTFAEIIPGFNEFSTLVGNDFEKMLKLDLKGIKALDDETLNISLNKPEPNLIYFLAMTVFSPIPKELILYNKNDFNSSIIGTGPFMYVGMEQGAYILKKFNDFRIEFYPTVGDRYANVQNYIARSKEVIPYLEQINFYPISTEEDRWNSFFNKKIDILAVPKSFLPDLFKKQQAHSAESLGDQVSVKHFPILSNRWLSFNWRDPILGKNKKVRKAIAFAIDREKYIADFSQRTSLKSHSILVPGIPGYYPSRDLPFDYDIEKAKLLLKEAGFGENKILKLKYSTRGNQVTNINEAEFFKIQLAKIGINLEIEVLSFSDFLKKGRAGELQLFTDNWLFDYPDGENIFQLLISKNAPGINKSGYSNQEVDALYLKLRSTVDKDEKIEIMNAMEDMVMTDLPWVPLMYENAYVLHYENVKNYRKSSVIRDFVKYLKVYSREGR